MWLVQARREHLATPLESILASLVKGCILKPGGIMGTPKQSRAEGSQQSKICPSCDAKNKASWEFCARCGESLEGATLVAPGAASSPNVPAPDEEPEEPFPVSGMSLLLVVAVILFGAVAVRQALRRPVPYTPSPDVFSAPSSEALPVARATVPANEPGAADFEEGRRRFLSGDAGGAVPFLARAVQARGDNAEYQSWYGRALWKAGLREEALRALGAAAQIDPRPAYTLDYAKILDGSGRSSDAVAAYRQVLAADPDNVDALRLLGQLFVRAGQTAEARPYLERAAQRNPDDLLIMQTLGEVMEAAGDSPAAAAQYRKVLERMPNAAVTRGLLAEVLLKQGAGEEAVAVFREGVRLNADDPLLHRGLASMLERTGQVEQAIAEYRQYARLAPQSADARQLAERAERLERRQAGGGSSNAPPGVSS